MPALPAAAIMYQLYFYRGNLINWIHNFPHPMQARKGDVSLPLDTVL